MGRLKKHVATAGLWNLAPAGHDWKGSCPERNAGTRASQAAGGEQFVLFFLVVLCSLRISYHLVICLRGSLPGEFIGNVLCSSGYLH